LAIFKPALEKLPGLLVVMVIPRNVFMERLRRLFESEIKVGRLVLLNHLTDSELAFLYQKAHAFVFPSLSEGFGLPGLEAMSLGTSLVASDIPVFHEILDDQYISFDPENIGDIVEKLRVASCELRVANNKLKTIVDRFSFEKMTRNVVQLYNNECE